MPAPTQTGVPGQAREERNEMITKLDVETQGTVNLQTPGKDFSLLLLKQVQWSRLEPGAPWGRIRKQDLREVI